MKKILSLLLLCSSFYLSNATDVYIGPKIGLNASTIKLSNVDAASQIDFKLYKKFYVGPNVGINFLFKFNNYIALQYEFNFTMKGLLYKYADVTDLMIRTMQVEVPLLIKAGYGKDNWFVFGSFGPYVGVNTFGQHITKYKGVKVKEDLDFDKDGYARVDVGLGIGVGGMYKLGKGSLDVELRGNIGFIKQNKYGYYSDYDKTTWRSLSFNVAYLLPTKNH